MQVSATLIAAQQAAREARTRTNFAAALEKTSGVNSSFSPLPLKQTAAPAQTAAPQTQMGAAPARMGQHVNILV
jgi:hypothetical protein